MTDISGPAAKVQRAYVHVQTLESLIESFTANAYRVDMKRDDMVDPDTAMGDVVIFASATEDPPSELWGPIIGDAVHDLRSALDQLVWALSVAHQANPPPPDPIPRGNPWRQIAFPICLNESAWVSAVQNQLWAIDPALAAGIKTLQPFETGKLAPEREPLAVLQELWNIDKHRHLHLVNATVELHDVLSVNPFPHGDETDELMTLDFEIVSKRAAGELVGETEVGRARMVPKPGGLIAVSIPEMHMNARIAIQVAFDQGAPAYGAGVIETLRSLGNATKTVIRAV
jgi:hypothetical protein